LEASAETSAGASEVAKANLKIVTTESGPAIEAINETATRVKIQNIPDKLKEIKDELEGKDAEVFTAGEKLVQAQAQAAIVTQKTAEAEAKAAAAARAATGPAATGPAVTGQAAAKQAAAKQAAAKQAAAKQGMTEAKEAREAIRNDYLTPTQILLDTAKTTLTSVTQKKDEIQSTFGELDTIYQGQENKKELNAIKRIYKTLLDKADKQVATASEYKDKILKDKNEIQKLLDNTDRDIIRAETDINGNKGQIYFNPAEAGRGI